ncbi:flavin-containing monooxygenase [Streptomyces tagetis]|uniref:NAD(P)/FAD-dependent oxidoreductase n=1 Tax=Streptomyces tagetis TaxID=2820809 RepID=A0A940XDI7_9ACTN|nr:NAD(P)/FAD-dependent oxidoreductase [Streptomyces sp. RG38]MBQ0826534.1 NAD(P)/FAD-dependent oxidoreductase [Streptomyces sp. RG38]
MGAAPAETTGVVIIGSGFGGIAAAVKLLRSGVSDFVILEQSEGIGGTWWDNRYPGCEVDIPSHAYSFSFMPHDWPRTHAGQPELQRYAEATVDRFGLRGHIRLGTRVEAVRWQESEGHYRVETGSGTLHARFVISAVGLLNVPRYPEWPGLEEFAGESFHTARWDHSVELEGKRVAVVGTGSTAVQVVPAIADRVAHLYVHQREPGWVEPKGERAFSAAERERFRRRPLYRRLYRYALFAQSMGRFRAYDAGSRAQRRMRELCLGYLDRAIRDPETRRALTPEYPWGCKRPIYASSYYPAFNEPHVELVPHPVRSVTPKGVVDVLGEEREVDVLILSTGFQPTRFLSAFTVTGTGGRDLQEYWGDRPRAFLGVTVPEFPNFFILYGPNTNGGFSIIAQLERQAEMAARAIRAARRKEARVETEPAALERYVRWLDRQFGKRASAMEAGCNNYYHTPSGANVTQWPRTHLAYYVLTKTLARRGLTLRRR